MRIFCTSLYQKVCVALVVLLFLVGCFHRDQVLFAAQLDAPSAVVLVSFDGAGRDAVARQIAAGGALAELSRQGVFIPIEIKGHATETMPGHAEILTGWSSEQTFIFNNSDRRPLPQGSTVFERILALSAGKEVPQMLIIGGKRKIGVLLENFPKRFPARIDFRNKSVHRTLKVLKSELARGKGKPLFLFLHISEPDYAGHVFGEGTTQYVDGIRVADEALGQIHGMLLEKFASQNVLIFVTNDHGFDLGSRGHDNAPDGWLVTNVKLSRRFGIQADIPATILELYGNPPDERGYGRSLGVVPADANEISAWH